MSTSSNDIADNVLAFTVSSNGKWIPDDVQIVSISTSTSPDEVSTAQLIISDSLSFAVSNSPTFSIGHEIDIFLGYGENLERVFKGKVISHNINISPQEKDLAQLLINCESEEAMPSLEFSFETSLTFTLGNNLLEFSSETTDNPGSSGDFTMGKLKCGGSNRAKLGVCIQLEDVGERVSGKAFIDKFEHLVTNGEWITEVEFFKPDKQDDEDL